MDCHRVSIWLARDGTLNTYVAIKIPTAETPKIRNELECVKYLASKPAKSIPARRIFQPRLLRGISGSTVRISKLSGPSVGQMIQWAIRIREPLAQNIALQVTRGLAYLHSERTCHGNLTGFNLLFQLADFDS